MTELYKLPNGEWIDPSRIVRLIPIDASPSPLPGVPDCMPRCVLVTSDNDRTAIECSDMAGALHLADELAEKANMVRRARAAGVEVREVDGG